MNSPDLLAGLIVGFGAGFMAGDFVRKKIAERDFRDFQAKTDKGLDAIARKIATAMKGDR